MKTTRQNRIIELIGKYEIETQDELCTMLNEAGFQVTQATVSRDIRELALTKRTMPSGKQKYVLVKESGDGLTEKFARVLKDGLISMDKADNILVVRTVSGMAMAVAAAIDSIGIHEIVGSIAGDDTIMCAEKTVEMVEETMHCIQQLTNS